MMGHCILESLVLVLERNPLVGVNALVSLFSICPELVNLIEMWYKTVFQFLFSQDVAVRKQADTLLTSINPLLETESGVDDMEWYLQLLVANQNDNLSMLIAWGHLMILKRHALHRTRFLNQMLVLVETNFNSTRLGQRIAGFKAWRRLIVNLSFQDHLYHPKRLNLVLLPVWNCFKYEKSYAVRQACFETFLLLVHQLSCHGQQLLVKMFNQIVVPALGFDHSETRLLTVFMKTLDHLTRPHESQEHLSVYQLLDESSERMCSQIQPAVTVDLWDSNCFKVIMHSLNVAVPLTKDLDLSSLFENCCLYVSNQWQEQSPETLEHVKQLFHFLIRHAGKQMIQDKLLPRLRLSIDRPPTDQDNHIQEQISQFCKQLTHFAASGSKAKRNLEHFMKHERPDSPLQKIKSHPNRWSEMSDKENEPTPKRQRFVDSSEVDPSFVPSSPQERPLDRILSQMNEWPSQLGGLELQDLMQLQKQVSGFLQTVSDHVMAKLH
ncbi:hypothetical protein EDD86DRAFT_208680 [Gorgonomyces haynaldii]|nr:hypothetical protein EDD86DRAFT_208680 [Gorgonomyces haynaldii]